MTFDPANEDDKKLAFDCVQAFDEGGSWWTCHVFRLAAKGDVVRQAQLALAFPREVAMYNEWMSTPPAEFKAKWGMA